MLSHKTDYLDDARKHQMGDIAAQIKSIRAEIQAGNVRSQAVQNIEQQNSSLNQAQGASPPKYQPSEKLIAIANYPSNDHENAQDLDNYVNQLSGYTVSASDVVAGGRILASLHFPEMKFRKRAIQEAHANTFRWIFDPQPTESLGNPIKGRFVRWLKSADGCFWVSGKAGSGKSTLMKYLSSHELTRRYIREWTGTASLVTASFFFWNSGSLMQKSLQGLLQSLLHTVLSACPQAMFTACPSRRLAYLQDEPWTVAELLETITRITTLVQLTHKFCLFVDGLDEYDGYHRDVNDVLKGFSEHPNIKIILSSRPWNVFEDTFGQDDASKIYLHELTSQDISLYIREKLQAHPNFSTSMKQNLGYDDLVRDTREKSQGIFLWLVLAVRSLCEGLDNADDIATLRARLDVIPTELNEFFLKIIDSVHPVYRESLAEMFLMTLYAGRALPLMFYVALEEIKMIDHFKPFRSSEIKIIILNMKRRINGKSKGLMELAITNDASIFWFYNVDFLHRTLRDYLRTDAMTDYLRRNIRPGFYVEQALSQGHLGLLRIQPGYPEVDSRNDAIFSEIFIHAQTHQDKTQQTDDFLMGSFQKFLQEQPGPPCVKRFKSRKPTDKSTLVEFAVRRRFHHSGSDEQKQQPAEVAHGTPLKSTDKNSSYDEGAPDKKHLSAATTVGTNQGSNANDQQAQEDHSALPRPKERRARIKQIFSAKRIFTKVT